MIHVKHLKCLVFSWTPDQSMLRWCMSLLGRRHYVEYTWEHVELLRHVWWTMGFFFFLLHFNCNDFFLVVPSLWSKLFQADFINGSLLLAVWPERGCVGECSPYCEPGLWNYHQISILKINSRWLEDLQIRYDIIKILEENIRQNINFAAMFSWHNCSNVFLDQSHKAKEIQAK